MATGPEHYREAEKMLAEINAGVYGEDAVIGVAIRALGHAMLANAAAAGTFGESDVTRTPADVLAWETVAGAWTEGRRRAAERDGEDAGGRDFLGEYMAEVETDDEQAGAEDDDNRCGRPRSSYTPAMLDGSACVNCDRPFEIDEPTIPLGTVDGAQVFAHRGCTTHGMTAAEWAAGSEA